VTAAGIRSNIRISQSWLGEKGRRWEIWDFAKKGGGTQYQTGTKAQKSEVKQKKKKLQGGGKLGWSATERRRLGKKATA